MARTDDEWRDLFWEVAARVDQSRNPTLEDYRQEFEKRAGNDLALARDWFYSNLPWVKERLGIM